MRRIELVYMEMLHRALERKERRLTQLGLSKELGISLSTVSHSLLPLRKMGAVDVERRHLVITDPKRILYHWASVRDVERDVVYSTRVEKDAVHIEQEMPSLTMYGAYTAYRHRFGDVPADYSEVYAYADAAECAARFPPRTGPANLFVLRKEPAMDRYGETAPLGLIFVDLWNIRTWYAREFIKGLEVRIDGLLE